MKYYQKVGLLSNDLAKKPAVTVILNRTKSAKQIRGLQSWREQVGTKTAEKINEASRQRGHAFHELMETYSSQGTSGNKSIDNFFYQHNIKSVWTEGCLYNAKLGYWGRADMLCDFNGQLSLLDFKTSLKPKKAGYMWDNFLQTAAYAKAFVEQYGKELDRAVIVVACPKEKDKHLVPKLAPSGAKDKIIVCETLAPVEFDFQFFETGGFDLNIHFSAFKKRLLLYKHRHVKINP